MPQPTLGIMTLYLDRKKRIEERSYFRKLIQAGKKLGMEVFLFTPSDVDSARKRIYAFDYDTGASQWRRKWTSFPEIIFDRCRYQPTERFKQLKQFRSKYPDLTYLNRPLANKWVIHQLLHRNSRIRPHLPDTKIYDSSQDVFHALKQHKIVYLKPINGTGGRGILRVERLSDNLFLFEGRDTSRRIITPQKISRPQFVAKLSAWNTKQRYLIQQGLDLQLSSGRVHDYRLLIQKNHKGEWEVTGCAGRIGAKKSITSNLHGGGRAVPMTKLLQHWLKSEDKVEATRKKVYDLAHDVVEHIENQYKTMCELALDIAIDRSGYIWLLEINPKPSREVFNKIGELDTYRKAIARPLEYALWLYKQEQ